MSSPVGRNALRRPIDDMSLSYADVISELAVVRDGVLAFADSHFSTADIHVLLLSSCVLSDVSLCTSSIRIHNDKIS